MDFPKCEKNGIDREEMGIASTFHWKILGEPL
jgi:hypothetical protein